MESTKEYNWGHNVEATNVKKNRRVIFTLSVTITIKIPLHIDLSGLIS